MSTTATVDNQAQANKLVDQQTVPTFDGSNVWRSAWMDTGAYAHLVGIISANQAFAANAVVLEQSDTNTTPTSDLDAHYFSNVPSSLITNAATGVAYYNATIDIRRVGRWARLVVKHAGTVPSTFFASLYGVPLA